MKIFGRQQSKKYNEKKKVLESSEARESRCRKSVGKVERSDGVHVHTRK